MSHHPHHRRLTRCKENPEFPGKTGVGLGKAGGVSQTWFEELCEPCPHGFVKPYGPQCVGDELEAEQEERRRENGGEDAPEAGVGA